MPLSSRLKDAREDILKFLNEFATAQPPSPSLSSAERTQPLQSSSAPTTLTPPSLATHTPNPFYFAFTSTPPTTTREGDGERERKDGHRPQSQPTSPATGPAPRRESKRSSKALEVGSVAVDSAAIGSGHAKIDDRNKTPLPSTDTPSTLASDGRGCGHGVDCRCTVPTSTSTPTAL